MFTSRVAFNGKLERCISLSFAASINFSIFLRSDIFLCLLFILCCFRCLPRIEQDIFNSFRAKEKRWKSKSRSGEWEKCFTNWIEILCYKVYFTISRLKNLASTREILKECLIAYKQSERSTLNYNSTKPQTAQNINFISNWHLMLTELARRQHWFDIGADKNISRSLKSGGFNLWKKHFKFKFRWLPFAGQVYVKCFSGNGWGGCGSDGWYDLWKSEFWCKILTAKIYLKKCKKLDSGNFFCCVQSLKNWKQIILCQKFTKKKKITNVELL